MPTKIRAAIFSARSASTRFARRRNSKRDMDRLMRELKSTPPVEGQESRLCRRGRSNSKPPQERAEHGIPLHGSVLKGLREVGEQVGVPYDLE